jgi:hypothetical protein
VLVHFLLGTTQPGWTSIIVCIVFFSGFQLAMMGMLGEYIGRISEQVKGRPLYVVRQSAGVESAQKPAQPAWAQSPSETGSELLSSLKELAETVGETRKGRGAESELTVQRTS